MAEAKDTGTYYPKLPSVEVVFNLVLYSVVIFGSIFTILSSSSEKELIYFRHGYVEQGWKSWIGHYKDNSDFEWSFWEKYLWSTVVIGFTGHFMVARFADAYIPAHRFKVHFLYSLIFTVFFLGIRGLFYFLAHFFVQYTMAVLSKSVAVCWITGCLLAYSIVNETCLTYVKGLYPDDVEKAYFLLFSTAICNLRYIAFSIEYVWSMKRENLKTESLKSVDPEIEKLHPGQGDGTKSIDSGEIHAMTKDVYATDVTGFTFLDLLVYQMYYPLFYGGPIITYNEFLKQIERPPKIWTLGASINFVLGMTRYIFWHVVTDILLHFFYVAAVSSDYHFLQNLPLFKLLGVGLAQVIFFGLKYVCMYGTPSYFASSDNLDIPRGPHCVFAKHRITDMWKYFDKGLHLWLVRYIYIPCGGSKVKFPMAIVNSVLPFAFVCFWHGAHHGQMYWAFLSWVGVFLESCALKLYRTERVVMLEAKYLSPAWSRRLRALLSAPMLFLLLTSNLYFLSGVQIGHLFSRRLYLENFGATILMLVFFYSGCQSSMELE